MDAFRFSDHEIFDFDGRSYLYLVASNAVFEVDADTARAIGRAADRDGGRPIRRERLLDRIGGTSEERSDTVREWGRIGLLRPDPARPPAAARPAPRGPMPVKTLVLHVTDACNLSCTYCYHHGGGPSPGAGTMTSQTARKAVDFLMEVSGALEKVELVFFGGEPLLNRRRIAETVSYANRAAAERGKSVDFALTTNATLLDGETTAFLTDNRIGVTVSIDGLPEVHDRYRRFPDGSPSFAVVEPGIRRLVAAGGGRPVAARVTVAGDPDRVPECLDHLLALGFAEAGFAPVTTTDPAYQLGPAAMDRLLAQFERLTDRFLDRAREDGFLGFTNLVDLLVTLHEGEVKAHPCGAGLGLFAVSAGGGLYLCQRLTGMADAAMGDVDRGVDEARVEAFRRSAHVASKPQCRRCWARVICCGGCYHEALVREGSLTAANTHYCDWIRRWIRTGLKAYGRLQRENPDYLDRLSILRGHSSRLTPDDGRKGAGP